MKARRSRSNTQTDPVGYQDDIDWTRATISSGAGALSGEVGTVAGLIGRQGTRIGVVGVGSALIGGAQTAATDKAEGKQVTVGHTLQGASFNAGLGLLGQVGVETTAIRNSTTGMSVGEENVANGIRDTAASTGLRQGTETPLTQTLANAGANVISNTPNTGYRETSEGGLPFCWVHSRVVRDCICQRALDSSQPGDRCA